MTTTEWIIDLALVFIVLRQVRRERLTPRFVLMPLGIVAFTAHKFLHGLPTAGNDLWLVAGCVALGASLGVVGGLLTRVSQRDGAAYVQAGPAAAAVWVGSMTARLGFIVWITHQSGGTALAHFSAAHDITGPTVWQTALVLLALSEVVVRLGIVVGRALYPARAEVAATVGAAAARQVRSMVSTPAAPYGVSQR